jgi:hypothetical protein
MGLSRPVYLLLAFGLCCTAIGLGLPNVSETGKKNRKRGKNNNNKRKTEKEEKNKNKRKPENTPF